jgi:hypothetical protein
MKFKHNETGEIIEVRAVRVYHKADGNTTYQDIDENFDLSQYVAFDEKNVDYSSIGFTKAPNDIWSRN